MTLTDQFGTVSTTTGKAARFCNPVDENGEGINDPTAHLACYDLPDDPGFQRREVIVENHFGTQTLRVMKRESLCVGAEKDGVPSSLRTNDFQCYRVQQVRGRTFTSRTVSLQDQFEAKQTVVVKPQLLCNPVDRDGQGIVDPAGHLTCYRIRDAEGTSFQPRDVTIEDPFSRQDVRAFRGTCRKIALLCVPSTKRAPGQTTTTTTLVVTSTTLAATPTTLPAAPTCDPVGCDDGNPCTVDACTNGVCTTTARPGPGGVDCELARLLVPSLCGPDPLHAKLAKVLSRNIRKARTLVGRAAAATNAKKVARFTTRADRQLAAIRRRAAKLAKRGRITAACQATLDGAVAARQTLIDELGVTLLAPFDR